MLKIYDVGAVEINASCVFEYKGKFISCSTVFAPNNNVLVFSTRQLSHYISPEFFTVEQAIDWVNEAYNRKCYFNPAGVLCNFADDSRSIFDDVDK